MYNNMIWVYISSNWFNMVCHKTDIRPQKWTHFNKILVFNFPGQ